MAPCLFGTIGPYLPLPHRKILSISIFLDSLIRSLHRYYNGSTIKYFWYYYLSIGLLIIFACHCWCSTAGWGWGNLGNWLVRFRLRNFGLGIGCCHLDRSAFLRLEGSAWDWGYKEVDILDEALQSCFLHNMDSMDHDKQGLGWASKAQNTDCTYLHNITLYLALAFRPKEEACSRTSDSKDKEPLLDSACLLEDPGCWELELRSTVNHGWRCSSRSCCIRAG